MAEGSEEGLPKPTAAEEEEQQRLSSAEWAAQLQKLTSSLKQRSATATASRRPTLLPNSSAPTLPAVGPKPHARRQSQLQPQQHQQHQHHAYAAAAAAAGAAGGLTRHEDSPDWEEMDMRHRQLAARLRTLTKENVELRSSVIRLEERNHWNEKTLANRMTRLVFEHGDEVIIAQMLRTERNFSSTLAQRVRELEADRRALTRQMEQLRESSRASQLRELQNELKDARDECSRLQVILRSSATASAAPPVSATSPAAGSPREPAAAARHAQPAPAVQQAWLVQLIEMENRLASARRETAETRAVAEAAGRREAEARETSDRTAREARDAQQAWASERAKMEDAARQESASAAAQLDSARQALAASEQREKALLAESSTWKSRAFEVEASAQQKSEELSSRCAVLSVTAEKQSAELRSVQTLLGPVPAVPAQPTPSGRPLLPYALTRPNGFWAAELERESKLPELTESTAAANLGRVEGLEGAREDTTTSFRSPLRLTLLTNLAAFEEARASLVASMRSVSWRPREDDADSNKKELDSVREALRTRTAELESARAVSESLRLDVEEAQEALKAERQAREQSAAAASTFQQLSEEQERREAAESQVEALRLQLAASREELAAANSAAAAAAAASAAASDDSASSEVRTLRQIVDGYKMELDQAQASLTESRRQLTAQVQAETERESSRRLSEEQERRERHNLEARLAEVEAESVRLSGLLRDRDRALASLRDEARDRERLGGGGGQDHNGGGGGAGGGRGNDDNDHAQAGDQRSDHSSEMISDFESESGSGSRSVSQGDD